MQSSGGKSKPIRLAWTLIALTLVLILALFWQLLDVYFVLGGEAVEPTSWQRTRYLLTVCACGLSAIGGAIAASRAGRTGVRWVSLVTVVLALVAAVLFAVPHVDFKREPQLHPLPDNYDPCFSGSNKCN